MLRAPTTRRRALTIMAAASAIPFVGTRRTRRDSFEWTGTALGADARIVLFDTHRLSAKEAVGDCLAEIERLEQAFSLYRSDSEVALLNRAGVLRYPSLDLRRLLEVCRAVNSKSDGLFDPTVQRLWRFYAQWFGERMEREPPTEKELAHQLSAIGFEHLNIGAEAIELSGSVQVTLNGIAQGYITDRIAELLRDRGWCNVLIDLGEVRALGGRPDGAPFTVRVRESGLMLPLANMALATSSAGTLVLSAAQGLAHILHPRTGATPAHWASVTVQNASATVADALSTALFLAGRDELQQIVRGFPGTTVWAVQKGGSIQLFAA